MLATSRQGLRTRRSLFTPARSIGTTTNTGVKHVGRTLAEFSLQGKVCVVTGGARGLGYVMSQGFIEAQVPSTSIYMLTL